MTREEEIEQQTFVYYETCSDEDILKSKGFIDGAKWADKTMIEKACRWLKSYRQDTHDGMGYIAGIVNDKTIEDFRKAMEE